MVESRDSEQAGDTSAGSALERAQAAIDELEKVGDRHRRLGWLAWLAVVSVIVLAVGGLVIHTFFEQRVPQIDSTSVSLLAVALIAPFVPRLKALEVGGAKAEWQESAQVGLKEIVAVLRPQQEAIEELYDNVFSGIASGTQPEVSYPDIGNSLGPVRPERPPRPLRSVLWFDDFPGSSENELATLRKFLHVIVARSREQAVASISRDEVDAVIVNARRGDPDVSAPPVGLAALVQLSASRRLPVFVYISQSLAAAYGKQIDRTTVTIVTSWGELVLGLRLIEGAALEQFAITVAARNGALANRQPDEGVDLIVSLVGGKRVGIEVGSWLARPQMGAFTDRARRLVEGLAAQRFHHAILLTRTEFIDDRRRQWALDRKVEVVGPEELQDALSRIERG